MAFLNKDELKTVATEEVVNLITNKDDKIVIEIIEESIDLMKSYMYKYYDVKIIFDAIDNKRSKVVLKYLKDIVIYEIYTRRTHNINEVAKIRYDEAILWLEKISNGKITPNLPIKDDSKDNSNSGIKGNFIRWGSNKPYKNIW